MAYWYMSDPHFWHTKVIQFLNRPFANVREMNDCLLKNINDRVMQDDTLVIAGDFSFYNADKVLDSINCDNILFCVGSHDRELTRHRTHRKIKALELEFRFPARESEGIPIIVVNHYPHLVWHQSHWGSWHLFGHVHCRLGKDSMREVPSPYKEAMALILERSKCHDISVEGNNYEPYSEAQLKAIMSTKEGFLIPYEERKAKKNA